MRRLGRIKVSESLILQWLDFSDAIIRDVSYNINSQTIDIVLESLEMPKVEDGDAIPTINPIYILDEGKPKRVKEEGV